MRGLVRAAWPVVETIAGLEARATRRPVRWWDEWTPEFDLALDTLPGLPDCPHDLYRELVKPTRTVKKHPMVLEERNFKECLNVRELRRARAHR